MTLKRFNTARIALLIALCGFLSHMAVAQEVVDAPLADAIQPEIVDADLSGLSPEPISATAPAVSAEEEQLSDKFLMRFPPEPIPAPAVMWLRGDGQPVTLENYRGKWVVLNLWATWCVPCVAEMPTLDKLHRRYSKAGLEVVAINVDGQAGVRQYGQRVGLSDIQNFYRQAGVRYLPIHLDTQDIIPLSYQVKQLPTTFMIDPTGRVVGVLDGAEDWFSPRAQSLVERALRSMVAPS